MKQKIILFYILTISNFFCSSNILGQDKDYKSNVAYFELGGNCILYSFNYEREILDNLSPRIGLSIFPLQKVSNSGPATGTRLLATFLINYFIDLGSNNKIEFGVGLTNIFSVDNYPAISLGYRYSPFDGGILFKITYTPILESKLFDSHAWFGIGIGIRF